MPEQSIECNRQSATSIVAQVLPIFSDQQFPQFPHVIRDACFHGRSNADRAVQADDFLLLCGGGLARIEIVRSSTLTSFLSWGCVKPGRTPARVRPKLIYCGSSKSSALSAGSSLGPASLSAADRAGLQSTQIFFNATFRHYQI